MSTNYVDYDVVPYRYGGAEVDVQANVKFHIRWDTKFQRGVVHLRITPPQCVVYR